jgi:hypothetical protein
MIERGSVGIGELMKGIKHHRAIGVASAIAAVVSAVALVAPAPASAPVPPVNDDYLASLELNSAGTKLNSTDTIKDVRNTTSATVQGNVFNPCGPGCKPPPGPAERTSCHGTGYGNTIWYDFFPQAGGFVRIRTSGFDNVIALYTFSTNRHSPSYLIPHEVKCVHSSSFPSEELDAQVKRGIAYTFQIGGAGSTGGQLEMLFDYEIPLVNLTVAPLLQARPTSNGVSVLSLTVTTLKAATVQVSCGRFCSTVSKHGNTTESFPELSGAQLPAGSQLTIRVTAPHAIGAVWQYNIIPGNFKRTIFCTEPGSRKLKANGTCH